MRKILLLLIGWLGSYGVWAQQTAQYTQYIFNGLGINPAYAGSKEIINVNGLYRAQWTGLEGAPNTQTISIDGAVVKNKVGIGLLLVNDQIGAQGQKSISGNAAFRVRLSETARLALGIAAGAAQYYTDGTQLRPADQGFDPTIPSTKVSMVLPELKAGLFFNTERFYAGISAFNVVRFKNKFVATPARHFYFTTGYIIPLGDWFKFKPSILVKEDFKSQTTLDLNAFMLVGDRLWLGGTYRRGIQYFNEDTHGKGLNKANAWALVTEIYLTEKVKVGYAHDFTLTSLREYAGHEISLGFYFFKKEGGQTLTIRHF